jgi:hypothetical protein
MFREKRKEEKRKMALKSSESIMDNFIRNMKDSDLEKMFFDFFEIINSNILDDNKKINVSKKVAIRKDYISMKANRKDLSIGYTFGLKDPTYAFGLAIEASKVDNSNIVNFQNYWEADTKDKSYHYFKIYPEWTVSQAAKYCADIIQAVYK